VGTTTMIFGIPDSIVATGTGVDYIAVCRAVKRRNPDNDCQAA